MKADNCPSCLGKGWDIYNDVDGSLGDVQRCDCGLLPDDESAWVAARVAGVPVDLMGNVGLTKKE